MKRVSLLAAMSIAALLNSCGVNETTSTSSPFVTDVEHSDVKRQSIGNCWLYATASWAESLHLSATREKVNLSETYWTWWHYYNELMNSPGKEIQSGGNWSDAGEIILKHGYMFEGDFVPAEATVEMSARQAKAEQYINQQLKSGGKLARANQRTAATVRRELDAAFGTSMAKAEKKAHEASDFVIGKSREGDETLDQAFTNSAWEFVNYPRVFGKNAAESAAVKKARQALLVRVMKALNDHQPVVMSFMVDFNALDTRDATFKLSTLKKNGIGHQGGHMVVLEDYTVDQVPGVGEIGEGDVSDDLKAKALKGRVRTLKVKNSWGTNRADRGLTDGYNRLEMDYLNATLEWKDEDSGRSSYYTTLTDFVLPPGY